MQQNRLALQKGGSSRSVLKAAACKTHALRAGQASAAAPAPSGQRRPETKVFP